MRSKLIYKAISGRRETSQYESDKQGVAQEELKEILADLYQSQKELETAQCQLKEQSYKIKQLEIVGDTSASVKKELQELTKKLDPQ